MKDWPKVESITELVPGAKVWIWYNKDNFNNKEIEIRGVIDTDYFVYKEELTYSKEECRYHIEHQLYFALLISEGCLYKL